MEQSAIINRFTGFDNLYGNDLQIITKQIQRYKELEEAFINNFGESGLHYFSSPGRIEIGGNHTDHNNGKVLASSINLDSIALVSKNTDNEIIIFSKGYKKPFKVKINELEPHKSERGTTLSLIKGITSKFIEANCKIGGLNICMSSDVLPGSGLSSSASFEVLIGTILNTIFNKQRFSAEELAQIGQYAENVYFGKPSGLMDQMACAIGGIVYMDFKNSDKPLIKKINFDFAKENYTALVVDTGGNHANLIEDYAAIPAEMKNVAKDLGRETLRDIDQGTLKKNYFLLRKKYGDRALLRAIHYLNENDRVDKQFGFLVKGQFREFLECINASGDSSYKLLQNIYSPKNFTEQGIAIGLAITENYIKSINEGACRVHGGGFAGTILVFLPEKDLKGYLNEIEHVFGKGCATILSIRNQGTVYLNELN